MKKCFRALLFGLMLFAIAPLGMGQDGRQRDVIYGRKFGVSLTLDVFKPAKSNNAAVVFVVSGGWFSSVDSIRVPWCKPFTDRGYTVFAVVHGSQPRFTIPEAIEDLHLATRFIRSKAKDFGIDPNKIGITGGSAGGHLSLMMGVSGRPPVPSSKNPVEAFASGANAVACFFPPTDFLNWGEKGVEQLGRGPQAIPNIVAPFDFVVFNDKKKQFEAVEGAEQRRKIGREISPITFVSKATAPTLIIHGDADKLVSIQQAEIFIEKMKKAGAVGELDRRKGAAHGWLFMEKDLEIFASWFDKHLLGK